MHRLLALVLAPTLLYGIRTPAPDFTPPERMVTAIEITCSDASPARRHYTDQQSMGEILNYLRNVEFVSDTRPAPPDECSYTIILTHSTGNITVYRQLGNRCLSKNNLPYQNLDPEQGETLSALYHSYI